MNIDKFLKTEKQKAIYEGLNTFGSEISGFYLSALMLIESDIPNRANLIMLCLREIDCGLRDFLGMDDNTQKNEKDGRLKKICSSLDIVNLDNQLVRKWDVAYNNIPTFVHRHGPWKEPRVFDDTLYGIWKNYCDVLFILVGSFYSLVARLERIMNIKKHNTKAIKGVISNLLRDRSLYNYFFIKFEKEEWFYILKRFYIPNFIEYDVNGTANYWPVLIYLEKVSKTNKDEKIFLELLRIINSIIEFSKTKPIKNYSIWFSVTNIFENIPNTIIQEYISNKGISLKEWIKIIISNHDYYIEGIANKLLPKFANDDGFDNVIIVLDEITKVKKDCSSSSTGKTKLVFALPVYDIYDVLQSNLEILVNKGKRRIFSYFIKKLNTVLKIDGYLPTIYFEDVFDEDFRVGSSEDTEIVLSRMLIDMFSVAVKQGESELVKKIFSTCLKYDYPIYKKIVFHFIAQNWESMKDIFFRELFRNENLLEDNNYTEELSVILKGFNKDFSIEVNKLIFKLISNHKEKNKNSQNFFKFKWLSALRSSIYFKARYEKISKVIGREEPFDFQKGTLSTYTSRGSMNSPKNKDELLNMIRTTADSLIEFLNNYRSEYSEFDQIFKEKPGQEGLAHILSMAVRTEPEIFIENLSGLRRVQDYYYYHILNGIELAIVDKMAIDFLPILNIVEQYVNQLNKSELDETNSSREIKKYNIITKLFEILNKGIKEDQLIITEEICTKIEILFNKISKLINASPVAKERDVLTYAYNTFYGRTIIIYVDFYLKAAKKGIKRENWSNLTFNKLYKIGIEGKILFGNFLPQINYLDHEFAVKKINKISDSDWPFFMSGYLLGAKLYQEIFENMREHYLKAIDYSEFNENTERKLVEDIILAYLFYNESLENKTNRDGTNSLIFHLLNRDDEIFVKHMLILADYIGNKNKYENEFKKLKELWKWIFKNKAVLESKLKDKFKLLCEKSINLIKTIDSLDGEFTKIVLWNIQFMTIRNSRQFFRQLRHFETDQDANFITDILIESQKYDIKPYDETDVKVLVERIYRIPKLKSKADKICNNYGEKDFHFLRKLYEDKNMQAE